MDSAVITTIISTGGAVIVGLGGMWISTNQVGNRIGDMGKRLDDMGKRIDRLEDGMARRMDRFEDELRTFKDLVNGKLSALDLELAKLMDGGK